MTHDTIADVRNALAEVFKTTIYPAGDKKIIAEFIGMYNAIRDYTARLKGYTDYDSELADLEKQLQRWHTMEVEFTPYQNK